MSAVAPGPASASPRTLLTLADGGVIDLLAPTPADYTPLAWAAGPLAKEARYYGATPGVVYSVAQHLTECAYAAFEQTGDREVAAYCALHDVHEAVWYDDTTPKKLALAAVAETRFGVLDATVMEAFAELTDRHDAAIHAAAGLAWPPPTAIAAEVKRIDRTLLVTEWRDLMGGLPLPNAGAYADATPLQRLIVPVSDWRVARAMLLMMWRRIFGRHAPIFGRRGLQT